MDFGLNGKSALVMASSGGLGLGIARALAAEGVSVMLTGRNEDNLAKAAKQIEEDTGSKAHWHAADLADPDTPKALVEAATKALGQIDILVNNTGGPPPGPLADADLATVAAQFQSMVMSVMAVTQAVLPQMRKSGWGRIVTVGSSGVEQPIPNLGISNALRGSLAGWSKSLAAEVAGDGVTVNMILPGRIHTSRVDQIDGAAAKRTGASLEEVRAASHKTIPVGRYGTVEEFASVAAFLASAPASFVTGSMLRCDGGMIRSV